MVKILIDEEYRRELHTTLKCAKSNIRAMMYRIHRRVGFGKGSQNKVLTILKEKASQGLKVQLIIDIERRPGVAYKENLFCANDLVKFDVECKELRLTRVCHAKMVIVDDREILLGSHNWTFNSLTRNLEISALIIDSYEAKKMARYFDKLFANAEYIVKPQPKRG
ncbi:Cardiolipin synthase [subsurface metagenome]